MKKCNTIGMSLAATLTILASSAAQAELVTATVTCDNFYAVYTDSASGLALVGGDANGWQSAETWTFDSTGRVYIAAWSDNLVAQGFLAQFASTTIGTLRTGDARLKVYATGIDRDNMFPYPTIAEMTSHISTADKLNRWESTFVGGANGIQPWGVVNGISTSANWVWWAAPGATNPFTPGSPEGEMLIFSFNVPSPAAGLLAAFAPLAGRRRRR